jgi:hypothetical protein
VGLGGMERWAVKGNIFLNTSLRAICSLPGFCRVFYSFALNYIVQIHVCNFSGF